MILLNNNWVSFLWYWWAAWWWKTILAAMWICMMCTKYPWVRYWVFRRYITDCLDTTFQSFIKALLILGMKEAPTIVELKNNPDKYDFCVRNWGKEVVFYNSSEIWFRWIQDKPTDIHFTKIWWLELTWSFVDEANECPEMGIAVLRKRVWRHLNAEYNIPRKVLCTFNPDKWWIYRTFYNPYKTNTESDDVKFIPALPTDNPYLTQEYLDELENEKNEVLKQRYFYGNFDYDDTPWRLFDYNAILNMWNNPAITGEKYITIDVARQWADKTYIRLWDWLVSKKLIIEDKSRMDELAERVRILAQQEWIPMNRVIADEDWVWWGLVDILRCQWFLNNARPLQSKKPNISTKRNYANLKTQCYYYLSDYVNTGKIRIEHEDKNLVEELDIIVEVDIDKDWPLRIISKEDMKDKLWRSPDTADSIMMRMFFEIKKLPILDEEEENKNEEDPLWLLVEIEFDDTDAQPF